jgi:hypothetical protein
MEGLEGLRSVGLQFAETLAGRLLTAQMIALSELGRRAYTNFWAATIARYILKLPTKKTITVKAISEATYIIPDDIIATLKEMQVLEHRKKGDAEAVINKAQIKHWAATNRVDMASPVDENAFVNRPEEQDEEEEEEEE